MLLTMKEQRLTCAASTMDSHGCMHKHTEVYLQAGVHLHEEVLASVGVNNELYSASALVPNCQACCHGSPAYALPELL